MLQIQIHFNVITILIEVSRIQYNVDYRRIHIFKYLKMATIMLMRAMIMNDILRLGKVCNFY